MRVVINEWPTKITLRAHQQLILEVTEDPTITSDALQVTLTSVKVKVMLWWFVCITVNFCILNNVYVSGQIVNLYSYMMFLLKKTSYPLMLQK